MGNDITSYRMAIGLYYCKTKPIVMKNRFVLYFHPIVLLFLFIHFLFRKIHYLHLFASKCVFSSFYQNISFTLFLLQLLLLSNDVAENPGPDTDVHDICIFHWNGRSVRNKLDYLQTIVHLSFV